MSEIELRVDNRYKDGNVVRKKGALRGNAKTMELKHLLVPLAALHAYNDALIKLSLNPPIVVSRELGKAIKENE